jgi:hypothetical protein
MLTMHGSYARESIGLYNQKLNPNLDERKRVREVLKV